MSGGIQKLVWTVRGFATPFSASVGFLVDILLFPDLCSDCDCDTHVTTVLISTKGANCYLNPCDNTHDSCHAHVLFLWASSHGSNWRWVFHPKSLSRPENLVIFWPSIDTERRKFFKSLLHTRLQPRGTNPCYKHVRNNSHVLTQKFPEIPHLDGIHVLHQMPNHSLSASLLPKEWKHLTPLYCYGDGNCLYR